MRPRDRVPKGRRYDARMPDPAARPLNLEDVASLAGVSRSTVSRVVNEDRYVSPATRARVLAVIEEHGFIPNPGGRMLVKRRSGAIGIVFMLSPDELFEDPYYFPQLLHGINQATSTRNYTTLLWLGARSEEASFQQRILQNRLMDGIVIASIEGDDPLIERLLERSTPFAMVERPPRHADAITHVVIDNVAAARTVVRHLADQGRRRIGAITGKLGHVDGQDRFEGYRAALGDAGLAYDERLVYRGDFSYRSGSAGARALVASGADAIFAASDRAALGAWHALQDDGVVVPDQVALVGFDDLRDPALQDRFELTSVQHHIAERARLATELLIDQIEGLIEGPQRRVLASELIVRASSRTA